ncbi:MAG: hypothetical protein Q9169_001587 [Polycauliona sp. 2 TL-2023]
MSSLSRLSFLLVYLSLYLVHAQLKQCFYYGGDLSDEDLPCDPEAETSTCCGQDWICGTNLFCESKDGGRYQGSCTDRNWDINNNPACPFSLNYDDTTPGYDEFNYSQNTTRCTETDPITICPNNRFSRRNNTCCDDNEGIVEITFQNKEPLPTASADRSSYYALAGLTIPTDGVYKPVGAAATTSESTTAAGFTVSAVPAEVSAPPPPPSEESSGLSTGAKAGIGIGVAVAVLAVLGAAIFFFIRRRKNLKNKDREQPSMSNYPQYSNVPQDLGPGGGDPSVTEYYKSSELPNEPARMELDSTEYTGNNKRPSEMPG